VAKFVIWVADATIHAEENNIGQKDCHNMPAILLCGENFFRMFRDVICVVGNCVEICEHNLELFLPRSVLHNLALDNSSAPLLNCFPGAFQLPDSEQQHFYLAHHCILRSCHGQWLLHGCVLSKVVAVAC